MSQGKMNTRVTTSSGLMLVNSEHSMVTNCDVASSV